MLDMKIKTSDLSGIALDWAVAKCEDYPMGIWYDEDELPMIRDDEVPEWKPSSSWSQGGPIIERERIELYANGNYNKDGMLKAGHWSALIPNMFKENYFDGETPLIAAMRCYVASKLGEEVEIPDELINKE